MVDLTLLMAALAIVAMVLTLARRLSRRAGMVLVPVLLVWSLLPWPWGLAGWLLGYMAGFSLSSGLLALAFIVARLGGPALPARQWAGVFLSLLVTAIWFYPMSLGLTPWDPFAAGFGSQLLVLVLLAVAAAAWLAGCWLLCLLLAVGLLGWSAHLLTSDNLWDYLCDPWLVCWALGWLCRQWWCRRHPVRPAAQSSD